MKILAGILILFLAAPVDLHQFGMHQEAQVQTEIDATPAQVWEVLTDFPTYSIWNPYIYPISVAGDLQQGARLDLTLHAGGKTITYQPTVTVLRPNEELDWKGSAYIHGVFDREQRFTLEPIEPNRTQLTSREIFTGLLIPVYRGLVGDAQHGLLQMNEALKDRVELLHPVVKTP